MVVSVALVDTSVVTVPEVLVKLVSVALLEVSVVMFEEVAVKVVI